VDSTRTAERGFTLLEVLVCVALLAVASAASLGALAAVARTAAAPSARDAALAVATNALARAHAAVAYASSPTQDGSALLDDRSWALVPGTSAYVAGAELRASAPCGRTASLALRLPVAVTYDAPNERLTVAVTYPRDPCRVGDGGAIPPDDAATVTLAETLPPSVYPPGQTLHRDVATPARM